MMEIRQMDNSHIQQIAELEKVCFNDPWSENAIRSELTNPLSYWLVAVENGCVVGYVGSQSVLGEADMMNLAVAHEHRGKGVGADLVTELTKALAERDVYSLTLEVRISNQPAISLYAKLGFVQVGLRPAYYHNPKEDALILRKEWKHENFGC